MLARRSHEACHIIWSHHAGAYQGRPELYKVGCGDCRASNLLAHPQVGAPVWHHLQAFLLPAPCPRWSSWWVSSTTFSLSTGHQGSMPTTQFMLALAWANSFILMWCPVSTMYSVLAGAQSESALVHPAHTAERWPDCTCHGPLLQLVYLNHRAKNAWEHSLKHLSGAAHWPSCTCAYPLLQMVPILCQRCIVAVTETSV